MKMKNTEPYLSTYLHQKGRRLGLPIAGNFELTARCNFNCPMCYVHMTQEQVDAMETAVYEAEMAEAKAYNARLLEREHPYKLTEELEEQYWKTLDISNVMAYVEIPSIEVTLPIMHTTEEDVLQKIFRDNFRTLVGGQPAPVRPRLVKKECRRIRTMLRIMSMIDRSMTPDMTAAKNAEAFFNKLR